MKRVLVIRHHVEDDAGLVGAALERFGFELTTVLVNENQREVDIDGIDIVVVLGSNSSVYDKQVQSAWLNDEFSALRRAHDAGICILGICFGAQVLCTMFGGTVQRAARPEEGWLTIDVTKGCALSSGPWFQYHGDHCLVPEAATVLASTADAVQIFTIGRHLAVQFHPEVDDVQLAAWFASEQPDARAHSPRHQELLRQTRDELVGATARASELVEFFLEHTAVLEMR